MKCNLHNSAVYRRDAVKMRPKLQLDFLKTQRSIISYQPVPPWLTTALYRPNTLSSWKMGSTVFETKLSALQCKNASDQIRAGYPWPVGSWQYPEDCTETPWIHPVKPSGVYAGGLPLQGESLRGSAGSGSSSTSTSSGVCLVSSCCCCSLLCSWHGFVLTLQQVKYC